MVLTTLAYFSVKMVYHLLSLFLSRSFQYGEKWPRILEGLKRNPIPPPPPPHSIWITLPSAPWSPRIIRVEEKIPRKVETGGASFRHSFPILFYLSSSPGSPKVVIIWYLLKIEKKRKENTLLITSWKFMCTNFKVFLIISVKASISKWNFPWMFGFC